MSFSSKHNYVVTLAYKKANYKLHGKLLRLLTRTDSQRIVLSVFWSKCKLAGGNQITPFFSAKYTNTATSRSNVAIIGTCFFFVCLFFLLDLVTFQTPLGDKNCSKVTGDKSSNFVWSQGKCWRWHQKHFRDKLIWKYYYITSPSQSQSMLLVSLSAAAQ